MYALLAVFSDWPHLLLLGGATLGGALVGMGILKDSAKWTWGAIFVLAGVIIEPIFTLWLFVYDENISRAQQSKIVALEEHLEPRALTDQQAAMVIGRVSTVSPKSLGHISYVFVASSDEEISLAIDLADNVFSKMGWTWEDWPKELFPVSAMIRLPVQGRLIGTGIPLNGVQIQVMDARLADVEKALVEALRNAGLENVRADRRWDEDMQHAIPRMTVQILIGMRPPLMLSPIETPTRRRYPKAAPPPDLP
jgi:hypothetical protein